MVQSIPLSAHLRAPSSPPDSSDHATAGVRDSGYLSKGFRLDERCHITVQLPVGMETTVNTSILGRENHKLYGRGCTLADKGIMGDTGRSQVESLFFLDQ